MLCAFDDIGDGKAIVATTRVDGEDVSIIVMRHGNGIRAYRNRCPHFSVGLDAQSGVIHTYHGRFLMCAHHGAMFRFEDGHCVEGPCSGHSLDGIDIRVRDGQVVLAATTAGQGRDDTRRQADPHHNPQTAAPTGTPGGTT